MKNINMVIGIEGTAGAGKTSICRKLLEKIENSIIIHGGNIYRAIVYEMSKSEENVQRFKEIDVYEIMKDFEIDVKLENRETVIYVKGKKIEEKYLQSNKTSILVSQVSNIANNKKLYQFGKNLVDEFRKKYNIILSSRDIVKMYPNVTYHFFIDASIEERVNRKYMQYNGKLSKDEIRKTIKERDKLQKETGYYKIYSQTKIVDVTECNTVEDATEKVFRNIDCR